MNPERLLSSLNAAQQSAVTSAAPQTLVLAGAGSGKTRVLVHRIAWCLDTGLAAPGGILAVTFTNKAAAEMRGRIEALLARPVGGMWVGTFHSIAHRLLRAHWREAKLPEHFQIMDSDDQQRVVRRAIRALNLDEDAWPPKEAQWTINGWKDEGKRPDHIDIQGDATLKTLVDIYREYETAAARAGLVDFAELLLRAYELLRDTPGLLRHYQERFRHLLVDEFQDTNAIQYAWLRLLTGEQGDLFAVGDDDQSIYSWRGAQVENMQRFRKDYPRHALVRLEQNYRSTGNILNAANALIARNSSRLGKSLWTDGKSGELLKLYAAYNDLEEARFCVDRIKSWHHGGGRYDECAILYRVSAQSRVMEDALRQADVPYRVHGGFKFYERAEIKDALAYLRLAANRADDGAFERIVNVPTRGVGQRSLEDVRQAARRENVSLWEAAHRLCATKELGARAVNALKAFLELIARLAHDIVDQPLDAIIDTAVAHSGLVDHYKKEKGDRGLDRIENLEELVTAARDFTPDPDAPEIPLLSAFLSHAALEAGEGQAAADEDSVQLMTLHSAKGLEFPQIYLVGMEEGLFPHQRSSDDISRIEEERRLCYVGMTRAMQQLTLSYAESRRLHGSDYYPQPSRFLREIPREFIEEVRLGGRMATGAVPPRLEEDSGVGLKLGQRVLHKTFGEGVVLHFEGRGAQARVQVNFPGAGTKWLVAAYAGLEAV
ncbi:MAG: DNA helicase II [Gammaproteobacteria bacterium]|nr:DNA helicase II [Gammaproteobacteria bacterium]MBI5616525.1 DNA helicase II [Gammaproteobacteria bacterium]